MGEVIYLQTNVTALANQADGTQGWLTLGRLGGLKVNNVLPSRYELAEAGLLYCASSGTHAGLAPVQAVPTTAAAWALYNGNTAASGLNLAVFDVNFWLVSGTTGVGAELFVGMSPTVQASAITTAALCIVKSTSGSSRTTAATLGANATLAGTPAWTAAGGLPQLAAASQLGLGLPSPAKFEGGILIPPGFAMGVTILSPAGTTPLYGVSITYGEIVGTNV